jgi:hypothetical protein
LYEPLQIGDEVALYIDGEEVLAYQGVPNTPTVLSVTSTHLEITTQSSATGVGDLIVNDIVYPKILATEGSNQLTRLTDEPGFIRPDNLKSALTHSFSGTTSIDTTNPGILDPENLSDLMAVLGQPPLSIPSQSFPLFLSAPFNFRILAFHILPQWTTNSIERSVGLRLARNGDDFYYLTPLNTLTQVGRQTYAASSLEIHQDDAVYVQLFNPINLARVSYQLDVAAV